MDLLVVKVLDLQEVRVSLDRPALLVQLDSQAVKVLDLLVVKVSQVVRAILDRSDLLVQLDLQVVKVSLVVEGLLDRRVSRDL